MEEERDVGQNTTINNDTATKEAQSTTSEQKSVKKPPKFVYTCQQCGQCCEKKDYVTIYFDDLERWIKDGSISYVMPFLQIYEEGPFGVKLIIKREKTEDNPSGCPLYDPQNKLCNLYSSMPVECAAYPLSYNGSKYYLMDKDCQGLGKGTMTKEKLSDARKKAENYYLAKSKTESLFPIVYGAIIAHIMKQSQEAMQSLSEEDRKKLEELLSKSKDAADKANETETAETA